MRVWIVTGASGGLGGAIAREALEQGDAVVGTARSVEREAERLATVSEGHENRFLAVELEATDEDMQQAVVDAAVERFGRIDVLVNCAGLGHHGAVEDADMTTARLAMDVNFWGPVGLTRKVLPHMRGQGSGLVANVSSMGVHFDMQAGNAFYTASKAALEAMSATLRNECGEYGVRVCVVEPGSFATGFRAAVIGGKDGDTQGYSATRAAEEHNARLNLFAKQGRAEDAGRAIVAALSTPEPPLTLAVGEGMCDAAVAAHERRIAAVRGGQELLEGLGLA